MKGLGATLRAHSRRFWEHYYRIRGDGASVDDASRKAAWWVRREDKTGLWGGEAK